MENNILIRCSQLGKLFTEPKNKGDKEAGNLSETSKTLIDEIFLREKYQYQDEVITDEIMKGILCESDSLEIAQSVLSGEFRMKNKNVFSNDYIIGTPDVILKDYIEDIKTSFDVRTFHNAEFTNLYMWQGLGYCFLTGRKKFRLIYCLVDTPEDIVTELKKRVWFKFAGREDNPDYMRISQQIELNHSFRHIPEKDRVKTFECEFLPEHEQMIIDKVKKAREYYDTLKL